MDIVEVKQPEIDAQLVAEGVALQLERRVSFRRAMKKALQIAKDFGAKGIKIRCAGRLGGAELGRVEQYHWGSNQVKANYGNTNYDPVLLGINPAEWFDYIGRAADTLHYFHGVNPLGMVYLTNMYEYGAAKSANEIHHQWLGQGIYSNALNSKSGPAPGFMTGGPNQNYSGSEELSAGPPMKAYIDTNDEKVPSWELSEPAIYYQAAYVKLLSKFVPSGGS